MIKLNIQFFASKKAGGSTKNGRDSIAKRLGAKMGDGEYACWIDYYRQEERRFILGKCWSWRR